MIRIAALLATLARLAPVLLATLAAPAVALTPLPPCAFDTKAQRFSDTGVEVYVHAVANDYAESEFRDTDGNAYGLLHHCPTGHYLLYIAPPHADRDVTERFRALVDTTIPVTLRQIGEDIALLGASVRMGRGDIGTCDCEYLGDVPPPVN